MYLGGNRGVDVVLNRDVTNGRKLLILKDSYANSMVPYLTSNFSEIHLIDLRYYNFNVYDYIREHGITDAAAIYSVSSSVKFRLPISLLCAEGSKLTTGAAGSIIKLKRLCFEEERSHENVSVDNAG